MTAPRALLAEIVDYAGVFPPAALDVGAAVRNYHEYSTSPEAWMLGRFVVPVARLGDALEAGNSVSNGGQTLRIAAVLGADPVADIGHAHRFNDANSNRAIVDCVESRLSTVAAIRDAAAAAGSIELFAEVPAADDPETLIDALAEAGASGKIRTGGVTPDAFPTAATIVRFIRRSLEAGIRFKATAGLHHPLRAEYRLTYDEGAACGSMFGFLNVFLAAAAVTAGAIDEDAVRLLNEGRPSEFVWSPAAAAWNGSVFTESDLALLREHGAVSFGSCSFREPVDESRALGLIE
ncbi:MAG: hypothetical protein ABI442_05105 [Gemmatimonadaceae bacterium]